MIPIPHNSKTLEISAIYCIISMYYLYIINTLYIYYSMSSIHHTYIIYSSFIHHLLFVFQYLLRIIPKRIHHADIIYFLFIPLLRYTSSTDTSAGDTPAMREA